MAILRITNWTGRLGNCIMQIIRAIHYANINRYSEIIFPNNVHLNLNIIRLEIENINKKNVENSFFYLNKLGITDPSPETMKMYFIEHIKPILKIKSNKCLHNKLNIHIRSGDTFNNLPHPKYLPPPLIYYKNMIESRNWDKVTIVFEDNLNPCIKGLRDLNYDNVEFISSSLENDMSILGSSKYLGIGPGTFGLLAYFLSEELEFLYIPKYVLEEMPKGNWGVNMDVVELPNYIKCGEWRNASEQRKMLVDYKST